MQYNTAKEKLGNRSRRKLGNHTYLERRDNGTIAVKLHETDVVTFNPDGSAMLDSGGWRTITTKDRINGFGPVNVSQDNSVWYIKRNPRGSLLPADGYLFRDGMTINADGSVKDGVKDDGKDCKALKKRIKAFCDGYMDALINRRIEAPSSGDCFYCVMRTTDGNIPLGEVNRDQSHIISHMDEPYFVPSLVTRACEVFPISEIAKNLFAYLWNPEHTSQEIPAFIHDIAVDQIRKALKRYVSRQMGLAS